VFSPRPEADGKRILAHPWRRLQTSPKPTSGPNDLRFFRYPPGIGVKTGLARYGQIEWSRAVVGGGSIRAFLGRHMGPNPTDRANLGSKRHLICDGRGIPLALQLTGANRNDSQQALAVVDAIPLLQGRRGRPRHRPDCVLGDRGYDAEAIRQGLRDRLKRGRTFTKHLSLWSALICWRFLRVD
jgi:hypothetical protein